MTTATNRIVQDLLEGDIVALQKSFADGMGEKITPLLEQFDAAVRETLFEDDQDPDDEDEFELEDDDFEEFDFDAEDEQLDAE